MVNSGEVSRRGNTFRYPITGFTEDSIVIVFNGSIDKGFDLVGVCLTSVAC